MKFPPKNINLILYRFFSSIPYHQYNEGITVLRHVGVSHKIVVFLKER
jgi:hypothetical protein